MASSLSNFVNNLSEGIHKLDVNMIKNMRNYIRSMWLLSSIQSFKDDLLEYKCLWCNKNHQQKFDEKLKEQSWNTYNFSNHNNNKFILLLRKVVYPYECINDYLNILPEKNFLEPFKNGRWYWCRLCTRKTSL